MAASRHRRLQVLERRVKVADLYIKGWSQAMIAKECSISQPTICDDLAKIRADWRNSAIRDFDMLRERELQRIDRVEREAWAAWERSQQPVQSAVVTGEDITKRTKKSVIQKYGDPRFLDVVHKCIAQRRAMLGLDLVILPAPATPPITPIEQHERDVAETHARLKELGIRLGLGANALDPAQPPPGMFDEAKNAEVDEEEPESDGTGGW
jgi:hypothetical protein